MSTVRRDFFLDPDHRLSEQERALMTAMIHCLVGDLADELRAVLPAGATAANDQGNLRLIADLSAAGLLDQPRLMALLLRKADEEQISGAVRARHARHEARVVQALVSDEDAEIAASAMALILARGRRRDRFGQCLVLFDDLDRDTAWQLLQVIAAALRPSLAALDPTPDLTVAEAVAALTARHEPAKGEDALAARLIALLDASESLDEFFMAALAEEGEVGLLASALGRRSGLSFDAAFDDLLSGDERRAMLLLRHARVSREFAARVLAHVGDLIGLADAGPAITIFTSLTDEQVATARGESHLDPTYLSAVAALKDAGRG